MTRFCIAQLARERGISMSELHRRIIEHAPPDRPALRLITYRTVLQIVNGKTLNPQYDTLEGIALALGVEVRDLYPTKETKKAEGAQKT